MTKKARDADSARGPETREERLKVALKKNLKRRKAQAKARTASNKADKEA